MEGITAKQLWSRGEALTPVRREDALLSLMSFLFCVLTFSQLMLPATSAFGPSRCTVYWFVHYPTEEVASGTIDTLSLGALLFLRHHRSSVPQLSLSKRERQVTVVFRAVTLLFHRKVLPPSPGDD
jgi:hypothetical protein